MTPATAAIRRVARNDAASSILLRGATLPISAVSVIVMTKLVINNAGVENYAVFAILISLPFLIPISDFGFSVAITDNVAKYGVESREFRAVWRSSRLILLVISSCAASLGLVLSLLSLWAALLGIPSGVHAEVAGFIMTTFLALSIYLGAGQRLLLGLQKQKVYLFFTITAAPLSLLLVFIAVSMDSKNLSAIVLAYACGQLMPAALCYAYASKLIPANKYPLNQSSKHSYSPILQAAFPMMVISIALPMTYQSDRVFLAHLGTEFNVAEYSIASTVYMPVLSILTVGAQSLWPKFMKAQSEGNSLRESFLLSLFWFAVLGTCLMLAYWIFAPALAEFMSPEVEVDSTVFVLFGFMLFLFGIHAAPGMLLMDFRGRLFQAAGSVIMLACKIPLTILLVKQVGSPGAIIGTIIPLVLFMTGPCLVLCLLRIRKSSS